MKGKIRVIDMMTKDELEKLDEYETKIILARTPYGIRRNKRLAQELLQVARGRYEEQSSHHNA